MKIYLKYQKTSSIDTVKDLQEEDWKVIEDQNNSNYKVKECC
ncbi:hypothetical protein ACWKT2_24335 [Bacillus toyonensis]